MNRQKFLVRTDRLHLALMLMLTFSTGVVDAVGYLGLDRVFTGNMTGNVVLLGMAVVGGTGLPILRPALALAFFMLGAALAGRVLRRGGEGWSARTSASFLTVALGLWALTVFVALAPVHAEQSLGSTTTSAMALVMGIQAATAKKLKVAEITTVVVTSTITGLAADSRLAGGSGVHWVRRALAIVLILLGALTGSAALLVGLWLGLGVAAVIASVVVGVGHARFRMDARAALAEVEETAGVGAGVG
ncbi:YoaK family protein [Arthrobacter sp. KBS0702]|uniref:YoaK family protein n=1 Tax=Arthrobacter sp. KBS0702 TaxID=2578107 RepID=UPI0021BDE3B7|nr:YoaK family protein [Arthrobacter sp. KBS0702]